MQLKTVITLAAAIFCIQANAQKDTATANTDTAKKEFITVQVEAQFPGGAKGWQKYLEANLNADLGAKYLKPKKGQIITQVAIVSFLVNTNGEISEVQLINPDDVHKKLGAETVRVIKEGPRWVPATQNGKKVIYRQKQSVTWQVSGE